MKPLKHFLLAAVLMVGLGRAAQATPVTGTLTLTDCGVLGTGCPAATYTFSIDTNSATLSITINGALTAGFNNLIGGANLGFTSATLSGLTGSTSANLGTGWGVSQASLGSNGCGTNSGNFTCAEFSSNPTSGGSTLSTGGTYTWTWTWSNALAASDIFSSGDVHIGANYNPNSGLIVSQTINTQVPEPLSLLTLGGGLIGLGLMRMRRKRSR